MGIRPWITWATTPPTSGWILTLEHLGPLSQPPQDLALLTRQPTPALGHLRPSSQPCQELAQPPAGPPAPGPSGPYNQRTQDLAPPTGRLTPALRHLELLSQPSNDPAPHTSTPTITLGHPGPDSRTMSGTSLPTNRLMLDLGPTGKQPLTQNPALLTIGQPVPQNVPGLHRQVPHNLAPPTSSQHPLHKAT